MLCELCKKTAHVGNPHPVLSCPVYVKVPQPLKDIIRNLYESNPNAQNLASYIYDNLYAPCPNPNIQESWHTETSSTAFIRVAATGNDDQLKKFIEERIYLSVKTELLEPVFNLLNAQIFSKVPGDVPNAKRWVSGAQTYQRPDSIVIYLQNKAAVWRVIDMIRALRDSQVTITEGGRVYQFYEWFNDMIPPGTARIPDFRGISSAFQPDSGNSFGGELSAMLADAYKKENTPRCATMLDFMYKCLVFLQENNLNLLRPWHRTTETYVSMFPKGSRVNNLDLT